MWQTVENGEDIRPAAIDDTSSRAYIYVRRNIERVEATEDVLAHWRWEEKKIARDIWPLYKDQMQTSADIEYLAMISGVNIDV